MAFSITDIPKQYDWTVDIRVPADNGFKKVKAKVTFKYVTDAEYDELRSGEEGVKDLLREVLLDWDFTDENGEKIKDKELILNVPFISLCLAEGVTRSRMGVEEKN
jgi:hypothetical protein